jgi:hypothetical protein
LTEAENIAKNLSTVLAGLNIEAGKAIKRALILAGQLKEASLSLIIPREKEAMRAPESEYIICHLVISRTRDHASQTIEITY